MDCFEAANILGEAIANSEIFNNFRQSEENIIHDEKSQKLFEDYRMLQESMVDVAGQEGVSKEELEEARTKLVDKNTELNTYEVTKNYIESREAFENMMKQVNTLISKHIEPESECTGDCHSCGGCH